MTIYTRDGDAGQTSGPGGQRVSKDSPGVRALGGLDELNSHVGLCLAGCDAAVQAPLRQALAPVQGELLAGGAALACPQIAKDQLAAIGEPAIRRMEQTIDAVWARAGELTSFLLPGGCELACRLHVARSVCRRAERAVVACAEAGGQVPPDLLRYLNRLGDMLFALARLANHLAGVAEQPWHGASGSAGAGRKEGPDHA